jgi:hypothetical protein
MKVAVLVLCIIALVFARSKADEKGIIEFFYSYLQPAALFADFVQQYNKNYAADEFQARYEIFKVPKKFGH